MIREVTERSLTFKRDDGGLILSALQQFDREANTCTVLLEGEVTGEVSSGLYDELSALLSVGVGVVLDMGKVTFLSPGFMEDLIRLEHKAESGRFDSMPIQNVPRALFEEIRKAGFSNALDIELREDA